MNPKTETEAISTEKSTQLAEEAAQLRIEINASEAGALAPFSPATQEPSQFEEIVDSVTAILGDLPIYVTSFVSEYQRPIITVGLFLSALVTVRVILAMVDAVNDVPLLAPFFEFVGIGYSAWFVYRYLLRASNRQELAQDISALKDQVVGHHPM
ncbi:CAAD domain-containing protein [Phormidium pseudopriestleyi FRX01]|uniref:CAAD domain-containing protein n=1 Tax=Phormidium pseudopriestleyi FRX01 TaxID=1759528 RepID=A0ABS3FXW1_9CYAN|nr:CAAD domain-containing protein [Phormidium pseudopriestleyi]MBO0351979.1 CAAD domain-containing protein [Phormidium pseudopriestleyi FRX01]